MRRHGQEILDILIDNYLVDQQAKRLHVQVSEAEIDAQLRALTDAIKPKTLAEGLKEHHETLAEVRGDIRHRLLELKLAEAGAPPGHFVHAYAIFIPSETGNSAKPDAVALEQVAGLQKQLTSAAKFEEMEKQYHHNAAGRIRGGDIGIVFEGCPYNDRIVQAALKLKAGMITHEPIKTPSGYYFLMVTSTDSAHPADEDKLYEDAHKQYKMTQGSRNLPAYLKELRAKANITEFLKP